jgi:peptide methionine sulfoxide reductase MsrA
MAEHGRTLIFTAIDESQPGQKVRQTFERFWPAEEHPQDYYNRNPAAGYCQVVIAGKLAKFRQEWTERLRAAT